MLHMSNNLLNINDRGVAATYRGGRTDISGPVRQPRGAAERVSVSPMVIVFVCLEWMVKSILWLVFRESCGSYVLNGTDIGRANIVVAADAVVKIDIHVNLIYLRSE